MNFRDDQMVSVFITIIFYFLKFWCLGWVDIGVLFGQWVDEIFEWNWEWPILFFSLYLSFVTVSFSVSKNTFSVFPIEMICLIFFPLNRKKRWVCTNFGDDWMVILYLFNFFMLGLDLIWVLFKIV